MYLSMKLLYEREQTFLNSYNRSLSLFAKYFVQFIFIFTRQNTDTYIILEKMFLGDIV